LEYKEYDVFVIIYGILFLTREGINVLSDIAKNSREFSVIAPVSNESKLPHQKSAPPFLYQTPSVFRWAAEGVYREFGDAVKEVDEIDDFCLALRKDSLDDLPEGLDLIGLPQAIKERGMKCGIARGVYGHRYGNTYESGREDLMAHVPLDAREILDIGAARGLFGERLKKRQTCSVTGVDMESDMIAVASDRLDNVLCGDIEEVLDKGLLGHYDCIVCGDILEHLRNPWRVVRMLKGHLKKGGLFVASSPNIMNWAILLDQLHGRWDYVPFSILSGTHIRFFTKQTFVELFQGAGYGIKEVHLQSFGIPPRGAEFIATVRKLGDSISEEELRAHEIMIVAQA